jgi:uncharacterized membrane protein YidH (DUF202 family)
MVATERTPADEASPWATGFAIFASMLMIMLGVLHAIMGLVALFNDEFYVRVRNYTFDLDTTGWGWIHLILGIVVAFAGFAILSGQVWARAVGIGLAVLSAINNFFWLPYSPVWSFIAIGLAVLVIWALSRFNVDTV